MFYGINLLNVSLPHWIVNCMKAKTKAYSLIIIIISYTLNGTWRSVFI